MARVFPFILKTKHKTLHVKQAWAELEILQKKQPTLTFDRSSLILNQSSRANLNSKSCGNSIPTLHTNTYFE